MVSADMCEHDWPGSGCKQCAADRLAVRDLTTTAEKIETHGLDTQTQVFFYEQDYYCLSNFSSFTLMWKDIRFDTLEAAYHWEKFNENVADLYNCEITKRHIQTAASAHEAFTIAQISKQFRRPDWDDVKVSIMLSLLREKVKQHEYVRRKLLATVNRELVENSWRDNIWGWGPNKDGQNLLGKCWMQIRDELRADLFVEHFLPNT